MQALSLVVVFFVVGSVVDMVPTADAAATGANNDHDIDKDGMCSLYLAETVDDRGGLTMGVFTSHGIPKGSLIGPTTTDTVVPLVDIPLHNSPVHQSAAQEYWWIWKDFVWNALDVGGIDEGSDVKSASLGMGSMVRGSPTDDPSLSNAVLMRSDCDDANLHRSRSPGAGAISCYGNAATVSSRTIEAGDEVIFPHGYHWYINPKDQEQAFLQELPGDDPNVQEFRKRYDELQQKHNKSMSSQLRTKLWGILQQGTRSSSLMDAAVQQMSMSDAATMTNKKSRRGKRSPQWLRQNGMCLDNIKGGVSSIPHAGRGAFSTRTIEKGDLIAPAPVLHIADRSSLVMYTPHIDHETFEYVLEDNNNHQLLLNYCFGHPDSTKLLCPLGAGTSLINHSPTPNAAVRWATHGSLVEHQKEWLNMTVEELGDKLNVGLVLEYYALRHIEQDEEIVINYGGLWEEAWKDHVDNWSPPPHAKDYVSAADMNSFQIDALHTIHEQETIHSYPDNVVTSCYYEYSEDDPSSRVDTSGRYADPRDYTVTIRQYEPTAFANTNLPDYHFLRPCRVLERHAVIDADSVGQYEYTIQMLNRNNQQQTDGDQQIPDHELLIVQHVPRDAVVFTDFAYSTDTHLPDAFRHEMTMPDGLFPNLWKNLK